MLEPANKKYLYGTRNNMHVIDIASSEQHFWRVLNVISLVVYNGGAVLFADNRPGYQHIVQVTSLHY
ncbi:MAG: uS2 family ribosomal protein [Gammaproteobacteria bacterium]|nr:uS2 family ribosomal protein [Gammaproteobacteria bacterium]